MSRIPDCEFKRHGECDNVCTLIPRGGTEECSVRNFLQCRWSEWSRRCSRCAEGINRHRLVLRRCGLSGCDGPRRVRQQGIGKGASNRACVEASPDDHFNQSTRYGPAFNRVSTDRGSTGAITDTCRVLRRPGGQLLPRWRVLPELATRSDGAGERRPDYVRRQ